jgi:hypothetical protein
LATELTEEEIADARRVAREQMAKEERAAARARIIEEEKQAARREAGMKTGEAFRDERVRVFIDLPSFVQVIKVEGQEYHYGQTYEVPRHVAEGLRETMFRLQRQVALNDGRDPMEIHRVATNELLNSIGAQ